MFQSVEKPFVGCFSGRFLLPAAEESPGGESGQRTAAVSRADTDRYRPGAEANRLTLASNS